MSKQTFFKVVLPVAALLFGGCNEQGKQSSQRVAELQSEKDQAMRDLQQVRDQLKSSLTEFAKLSDKIDKLAAEPKAIPLADKSLEEAVKKITANLAGGAVKGQVEGHAGVAYAAFALTPPGGTKQTALVPFVRSTGGTEWIALWSDAQILSALSVPASGGGPISERGPVIRLDGSPAGGGAGLGPGPGVSVPNSNPKSSSSVSGGTLEPGVQVIDKDGRKVIRLGP